MSPNELLQVITDYKIELVIFVLYQVFIFLISLKLVPDHSRLVGVLLLSITPFSLIIARHDNKIDQNLQHIRNLSESSLKAINLGDLLEKIDTIEDITTIHLKDEMLNDMMVKLDHLSNGIQIIESQADYFQVLTHELERCPRNCEVWDVVMPLNPSRVFELPPLKKYITAIKSAVLEKGVKYYLIVLPREGDYENLEKAYSKFREIGVELIILDRNSLPLNLRDSNFTIYEHNQVTCEARRGDAAGIVLGKRFLNDSEELNRRRKNIRNLRQYEVDQLAQSAMRTKSEYYTK